MIDFSTWLERGAAVCVIGFGLGLIVHGARRTVFRNPEESWKQTEGTVTRSVVEVEDGEESTHYHPHIEYTYRVGYITYIGDRVAPLKSLTGSRWAADQTVRKYGLGRTIKVWFNPRNPGESLLEPGRQFSTSAGMAALGALIAFLALRWLLGT